MTPAECIGIAVRGTEMVMKYAEEHVPELIGTEDFGYQYSPEIFTQTDTDFALEVCERVSDVWQPEAGREIILNLPATVEMSTPEHLRRPDRVLRPGPDPPRALRDQPPPAQRPRHRGRGHRARPDGRRRPGRGLPVRPRRAHRQRRPGHPGHEPLLPGHRPADRLHVGGSIDEIRRTVEYVTNINVHPRHPYAGDLVYTAFSGSHQDAIKKGLEDLDRIAAEAGKPVSEIPWEAPYLPIDPKDVGRTYEAVIRVNSQSGKGGVAYLLKTEHSLDLPRRAQIEFSRVVQQHTDSEGGEVTPEEIWSIFSAEYLEREEPYALESWSSVTDAEGGDEQVVDLRVRGEERTYKGVGNGPVAAFVDALKEAGAEIRVLDYAEHALSAGGDAAAAAYVECEIAGEIVLGHRHPREHRHRLTAGRRLRGQPRPGGHDPARLTSAPLRGRPRSGDPRSPITRPSATTAVPTHTIGPGTIAVEGYAEGGRGHGHDAGQQAGAAGAEALDRGVPEQERQRGDDRRPGAAPRAGRRVERGDGGRALGRRHRDGHPGGGHPHRVERDAERARAGASTGTASSVKPASQTSTRSA